MASNPIPESIRRQVWDLLRPYADVVRWGPFTLRYVLHRFVGSDKGDPTPGVN